MSSPKPSNKALRIGIVLNQFPVPSETFIQSFISHLKQNKISLFAKFNKPLHQIYGVIPRPYINNLPTIGQVSPYLITLISILFYYRRFFYLLKKGISLKQLIADANILTTPAIDILHYPFANNAFEREHYAAVLGAKMTLSFRGSDLNVYPIYHSKSYAKLWPYVHKVQCNSIELAEKLKGHGIPSHIPIEIITPALRKDLHEAMPIKMNTEMIGTPENPLNIVTLGRLHWIKDYPLALRVMAQLKQKGITLKYQILGEGSEREHLIFLIHELGLRDEVELKGRVNLVDIKQYFSNSHIYLQTSLAEGFSNACIEAQAFGLPCIVPSISGMSTCIEDGKTGIIVNNRTECSFVEAILNMVDRIQSFDGEYTSVRIKKNFDLESQKQDWLSFFEDLI